jgi:serine/threonine-protein kinase
LERKRIGKYHLISELGRGGMANVYLGYMEGPSGFNKLVVIKMLRPMFANDEEVRSMFFDEARLAARLNHPNVVQTYEVGSDGDDHFLAMEYLEGQSLSAIRRAEWQRPLPIPVHLRIIADALSGLHYSHELTDYDGTKLDAVHRDVNPNNVFVTYDGQVKLLDFGIAKAVGNSVRTETGVIRGTMGYISPEQIMALGVDRRADVFAMGVILWEAATRMRMWKGKLDVAIMQAIVDGAIPTPRSVSSEVPEALERICMKALARKRDDRYPTAAAMQTDLEAFVDEWSPRVGARDSGKYLSAIFDESRRQTRTLIEARLARPASGDVEIGASASSGLRPVAPPPRSVREQTPVPAVPSERTPRDRASSDGTLRARASSDRAPRDRASSDGAPRDRASPARPRDAASIPRASLVTTVASRPGVARFAYAGAAIALGIIVWRVAEDRAASRAIPPAAPVVTTMVTSSAPPSPVAAPKTSQAASESAIAIDIRATPPDAHLFLDGVALIGNPTRATLPRDARPHELRAEAAGHVTERRSIVADHDVALTLALQPAVPTPTDLGAGAVPGDHR